MWHGMAQLGSVRIIYSSLLMAVAVVAFASTASIAGEDKDPGDHKAPTNGDSEAIDASVDESSGKAGYSVAISVPPGPGGLQPSLSLVYGGSTLNGMFGIGWSVPLGEIRCSSRFGVPSSQSECARFELNGQLLVEDLNSPAAYREFRTGVESFQRIRLYETGPYDGTWESVTPDGGISRYGVAHSVSTPSQIVTEAGEYPAKTVIWNITSQEDPFGNQIDYSYATYGDEGSLYPIAISYAGGARSIEFVYAPRPDPIRDFRGGVLTEISHRATDIVVKSNLAVLSRQRIRYDPIPGSNEVAYDVNRSRILGVTLSGLESSPGVPLAVKPETTFDYSRNDLPSAEHSQWADASATALWTDSTGAIIDSPRMSEAKFADVNGDGKQDAIVAVCPVWNRPCAPGSDGAWQVWIKEQSGWTLSDEWSQKLSLLTIEIPTLTVEYTSLTVGEMISDPSQAAAWGWIEYNGPQAHSTCDASPGSQTEMLYFNDNSVRYHSNVDPNTISPSVTWHVVDINGDGLSDFVASAQVGGVWLTHDCSGSSIVRRASPTYVEGQTVKTVLLNTGSNWEAAPASYSLGLPDFSRTFIASELAQKIQDGSHLQSVVNFWHDVPDPESPLWAWTYPGGGYWSLNSEDPFSNATATLCGDMGFIVVGHTFGPWEYVPRACIMPLDFSPRFVELNGDGLLDVVVVELTDPRKLPYNGAQADFDADFSGDTGLDGGANPAVSRAYVQNSDGSGFTRMESFDLPFPHRGMNNPMVMGGGSAAPEDVGVRLVDLNNDSLTDVIWTDPSHIFESFTGHDPAHDKRLASLRPHDAKGVLMNTGTGWCSSDDGGDCSADGLRYEIPDGYEFARLWGTRNSSSSIEIHGADVESAMRFRHASSAYLYTFTRPLEIRDLNGDGLPDLVLAERWATYISSNVTYYLESKAWINDPSSASAWASGNEDLRYRPPVGGVENISPVQYYWPTVGATGGYVGPGAQWMDVNDDGVADFVYDHTLTSPPAPEPTWYIHSLTSLPDLLTTIDNGEGGIVEIDYQTAMQAKADSVDCDGSPAAMQNLECIAAAHMADVGESLPADRSIVDRWTRDPVVKSIRKIALNQPSGTPPVEYSFAHPRWSAIERTSLGFRLVALEQPDGTYSEKLFYQDHGRAGEASEERVFYDSTRAEPLRCVFSAYEVLDGSSVGGSIPGSFVGRIASSISFNEYGSDCDDGLGRGAVHTSIFEYNDVYGFNFESEVVSTSPSSGSVTTITTPYEPGSQYWWDNWIKGNPHETTVRPTGYPSSVISRTTNAYGPHGRVTSIASQITNRDGTALPWSSGDAVVLTEYDSFGNVAQVVDPEGRSTEYCYDGDTAGYSGWSCPVAAQSSHSVLTATRDNLGMVARNDLHPIFPSPVLTSSDYSDVPSRRIDLDHFGRSVLEYLYPNDGAAGVRVSKTTYYDDAVPPIVSSLAYPDGKDSDAVFSAVVSNGFGRTWKTVSEGDLGAGGSLRYAGQATWHDPGDRTVGRPRMSSQTYLLACQANSWCSGLTGESELDSTTTTFDRLGRAVVVETLDGVSATAYRAGVRSEWASGGGSRSFDAALVKDARGYMTNRLSDGEALVSIEHCQNSTTAGAIDLGGVTCTPADRTLYDHSPDGKIDSIYDGAVATGSPDFSDPSHRLRYVYDTGGRMIAIQDPDAGETTTTYFPSGKIKTVLNSRSQMQEFGYDDLGRPEGIVKPAGEDGIGMFYRANELKLWRESSASYSKEFSYDAFGRVAQEVRIQGGRTFLMDTEWDQLDRPVLITYPNTGMKLRYKYVGTYLKKVCEPGNQSTCNSSSLFEYVTDVQYDDLGRQVSMVHGGAMTRTFGYNSRYYLDHQKVDQTYGDYKWSYTAGDNYDELGNVTEAVVDETISMATPLDATHLYTYDQQNRIGTWNFNNAGAKSFGYDACGNLTDHEGSGQSFTNASHQHAVSHRATDNESYTYDAGGNVASITGGTDDRYYKFDSSNRLVCVGDTPTQCDDPNQSLRRLTVIYDAAGMRIRQIENGKKRDYIGDGFEYVDVVGSTTKAHISVDAMGEDVAYHVAGGALRTARGDALGIEPRTIWHWTMLALLFGFVTHMVLIGGRLREKRKRWAIATTTIMAGFVGFPIMARAGGGGPSELYRRFIVNDPIGSGALELGEAGARIQTKAFRPFGGLAAQQGLSGVTPYGQKFAGHRFEENSGFYYMNARWMDAEAGRFVSIDPLVGKLGLPESHNGYSYVENNPQSKVDPTGLRAGLSGPGTPWRAGIFSQMGGDGSGGPKGKSSDDESLGEEGADDGVEAGTDGGADGGDGGGETDQQNSGPADGGLPYEVRPQEEIVPAENQAPFVNPSDAAIEGINQTSTEDAAKGEHQGFIFADENGSSTPGDSKELGVHGGDRGEIPDGAKAEFHGHTTEERFSDQDHRTAKASALQKNGEWSMYIRTPSGSLKGLHYFPVGYDGYGGGLILDWNVTEEKGAFESFAPLGF